MRCLRFAALVAVAPMLSAQLRITEVLIDPVGPNAGNQLVEIQNVSAAGFTPAGWNICVPFVYAVLPNIEIPAGGMVLLHIGASGTNSETDFFFPGFPPLTAADEFMLYDSGCFFCSEDIEDYVSWGGTGRIGQAVSVGRWNGNNAFATVPSVEGHSLALGGDPWNSESWHRDSSPTLGQPNATGTTTPLGTGCDTSAGEPTLSLPTAPVDGNLDFTIRVSSGITSAPSLVLIGIPSGGIPFFGCSIEVLSFITLSGTANAAGDIDFALPLSNPARSFTGLTLAVQGAVIDLTGPNSFFGMTEGSRFTTG